MKQVEMSKYLKFITMGIGILFLAFVVWFLPSLLGVLVPEEAGRAGYWGACTFIWVTAVPCILCLGKFWGICKRIGRDQSFTRDNASALRQMSHYLLVDCILYALLLAVSCIAGWYRYGIGLIFGIVLILFICIALTVLCAVLSHLVYKASQMQEDQDLTI